MQCETQAEGEGGQEGGWQISSQVEEGEEGEEGTGQAKGRGAERGKEELVKEAGQSAQEINGVRALERVKASGKETVGCEKI